MIRFARRVLRHLLREWAPPRTTTAEIEAALRALGQDHRAKPGWQKRAWDEIRRDRK